MSASKSKRYRSKYARYRIAGVQFENFVAVVGSPRVQDAIESDPFFGREVFEDLSSAEVSKLKTDAIAAAGGDADPNSDGDPNPADPEAKPNGKSGTGKGRGTKGK